MMTRLAFLSLVLIGADLPADIIKSEKSGPWSEAGVPVFSREPTLRPVR